MPWPQNKRCRDCKWWKPERKPTDGILFGECRRHAPLVVPIGRQARWAVKGERNVWPFTGEREWCGEFEDR